MRHFSVSGTRAGWEREALQSGWGSIVRGRFGALPSAGSAVPERGGLSQPGEVYCTRPASRDAVGRSSGVTGSCQLVKMMTG